MNLTSSPDPPVDVDESAMNHTSGSLQGTAAKMNDTERFHFKRSSYRCYSSSKAVILLLLIIFVNAIDAVFTPADKQDFNLHYLECLAESSSGVCPMKSATTDGNGGTKGAIGDWDVTKLTDMQYRTVTFFFNFTKK